MPSFTSRSFRLLMSIADHIAPRTTARIAFEVFCRTANPRKLARREREVVERAGAFMAQARHHRLGNGRRTVAAHEFRPDRWSANQGTCLVIHGWNSRTEHMRHVIEALLRSGLRVIALDMPGNGWSEGRRNNLALAVAATGLAAEKLGPFKAIVAHSFGGAVAVNAHVGSVAGTPAIPAERLVLLSTPNSMPGLFEDFGRFMSLGTRTQMAMADIVAHIAGRPLSHYVAAELLAEVRTPTLIVHAPDDKEIAFSNALELKRAGPHVSFRSAPGLGHRRILADVEIADAAAEFAAGGDRPAPQARRAA